MTFVFTVFQAISDCRLLLLDVPSLIEIIDSTHTCPLTLNQCSIVLRNLMLSKARRLLYEAQEK